MLIGVVGKPSAGKSTFFKAMTLAEVDIASYPFTTINPNHGAGHVKIECVDKEFNVSCNPREGFCNNSNRFVPVELMDVAGLVPGAHEGKGMGNRFLDDLRQANVLIHVVDASGSTDEQGRPVDAGTHDPKKDIRFLENELDQWYLGILKKVWKTFARTIQNTKSDFAKAVAKQFSGLKVTENDVTEVILKLKINVDKPSYWTDEEVKNFAQALRKTTKTSILVEGF